MSRREKPCIDFAIHGRRCDPPCLRPLHELSRCGGCMRRSVLVVVATTVAVAAGALWVVRTEPDWYERARYPLRYEQIVRGHAANYDLDPALLAAVIYTESRFDANAKSRSGGDRVDAAAPGDGEGDRRSHRRQGVRRGRSLRPGDQRALRVVVPTAPARPLRRRGHGAGGVPRGPGQRRQVEARGRGDRLSRDPGLRRRRQPRRRIYADAYAKELSGR